MWTGASPERAATGMKNFLNALTKGEALTKRQSDVFAELGIDGTEMAKRMQEDAAGGIIAVLDALGQLEAYPATSGSIRDLPLYCKTLCQRTATIRAG